MTPLRESEPRRIVPRWRSPEATVDAGEFSAPLSATATELPNLEREHAEALEEWRSNPSVGTAAELIGSSMMTAQLSDAIEPAEFLTQRESPAGPLLLRRAREILSSHQSGASIPTSAEGGVADFGTLNERTRRRVAPLKLRLRGNPMDGLAWLELGRLQATAGNEARAQRAVRIALSLAGESRYVLRSASRFYLHSGDLGTAHELLRRSPRTKLDPWLSAAEIAAAQVAGMAPRTLRTARDLVESGRFHDHDLSELRGALATVFQVDGRKNEARAMIRHSLLTPTENAVAQALWLGRSAGLTEVTESVQRTLDTPRSFEARSFQSYNASDWGDALDNALQWYDDEPFSGRAAVHASVIASVAFEDYGQSLRLLRGALRASRRNFVVQSNLVYALVMAGDVVSAKRILDEQRSETLSQGNRVVLLANYGLLAFRSGQTEQGRAAYRAAIDLAEASGQKELRVQARLYYMSEELASGNIGVLNEASTVIASATTRERADSRLALLRLKREHDRLTSKPL